jgi:hypothetical protein
VGWTCVATLSICFDWTFIQHLPQLLPIKFQLIWPVTNKLVSNFSDISWWEYVVFDEMMMIYKYNQFKETNLVKIGRKMNPLSMIYPTTCLWYFVWPPKPMVYLTPTHLPGEKYFKLMRNFELRRSICKFRVSSHHLQIEFGRYQGIPRHQRLCQ